MVTRELFMSRPIGVVATLAVVSCSGSTANSDAREPGHLLRRHPPAPIVETYDMAIAVTGKAPHVVFKFWECNFARPGTAVRSIDIARNNQTVCGVESAAHSIPSVWKYGQAGDGYEIVKCDPLVSGEYGVAVTGGEKGWAEFHVAEDGTVTITKGLTCGSMPSEWKQEPSGG